MATGRKAIELTDNTFPQLLARALRAEMSRTEVTRSDVCRGIKVSISTFYRLYNGKAPDVAGRYVDALAKLFGTDVVALLLEGIKDAGIKPTQRRSNSNRRTISGNRGR